MLAWLPRRVPRRGGLRMAAAWVTERALLPFWARLLIAVLLIAAGTGIGLALRLADPPATAGSTAAGSTASGTSTAGDPGLGPVAPPPQSCPSETADTEPKICLSQPYGDGDTGFVVHGSGFHPFTQVTVALSGVGASPNHPVTDQQGTFNYTIDQGHLFFHGPIPPGIYQVVVTEAGGGSFKATFQVNQAAEGGAPPAGPPPDQP
jgi:hypothetical protein